MWLITCIELVWIISVPVVSTVALLTHVEHTGLCGGSMYVGAPPDDGPFIARDTDAELAACFLVLLVANILAVVGVGTEGPSLALATINWIIGAAALSSLAHEACQDVKRGPAFWCIHVVLVLSNWHLALNTSSKKLD